MENKDRKRNKVNYTTAGHRTGGHKTADGKTLRVMQHPISKDSRERAEEWRQTTGTQTRSGSAHRSKAEIEEKRQRQISDRQRREDENRSRAVRKREYYLKKRRKKKRQQRIILLLCILVTIIVATTLILAVKGGIFKKSAVSDQPSEEQSTTYLGGELTKTDNQELIDLVTKYFDAKQKGDETAFKAVVDKADTLDLKQIQQDKSYITAYKNIQVNTKKGIKDNEYVAYIYYEVQIKDIKTPAPGSVILYLKQNTQGDYIIHNYSSDTEVSNYITQMDSNLDVMNFTNDVNNKFNEACQKDEDLNKFAKSLAGLE